MQKTISKETSLEGIGLHSGQKVSLRFKPAENNQGILFIRTDLKPAKAVSVKKLKFGPPMRRTTIVGNGAEIHTVEHLMAALWALEIDNITIETNAAEMPGLDGSAKEYYEVLEKAGLKEDEGERNVIRIKEPVWCEKGEAFIGIFPSGNFKISYILSHVPGNKGRQCLSLPLDGDIFYREVAPARTFCMKEEALMLLKMGFGKGANTANTLVLDENGPVDNVLRFSDEPVRHKMLDLIGDLYLLGGPIKGRVIAINSGHELNMEIVKKLKEVLN